MSRKRREYERRVNRVVDYIEKNPATELSLDKLARLAASRRITFIGSSKP
jgi:hypothetical protein